MTGGALAVKQKKAAESVAKPQRKWIWRHGRKPMDKLMRDDEDRFRIAAKKNLKRHGSQKYVCSVCSMPIKNEHGLVQHKRFKENCGSAQLLEASNG